VVRRVDPQELLPEPADAVEDDVRGEDTGGPGSQAPLDHVDEERGRPEVPEQLVEEGRVERRLVEVVEGLMQRKSRSRAA